MSTLVLRIGGVYRYNGHNRSLGAGHVQGHIVLVNNGTIDNQHYCSRIVKDQVWKFLSRQYIFILLCDKNSDVLSAYCGTSRERAIDDDAIQGLRKE